MKATLFLVLVALAGALGGCNYDAGEIFPRAPEGSFIKTSIGPGPTGPIGPTSGHTSLNPTGTR